VAVINDDDFGSHRYNFRYRNWISEAVGSKIAGRTTEDLFRREEIARRVGKASLHSLVKTTS